MLSQKIFNAFSSITYRIKLPLLMPLLRQDNRTKMIEITVGTGLVTINFRGTSDFISTYIAHALFSAVWDVN